MYLAGEKLAGEKGTPGLLLGPVNLFNGPAFSGVCCLLFVAGTCKYICRHLGKSA